MNTEAELIALDPKYSEDSGKQCQYLGVHKIRCKYKADFYVQSVSDPNMRLAICKSCRERSRSYEFAVPIRKDQKPIPLPSSKDLHPISCLAENTAHKSETPVSKLVSPIAQFWDPGENDF